MAMTGTTTTTSGWCAAESTNQGLFRLEQVERAYRACRRRKRGAREVQRYERTLLDRLVTTTDDLAARCCQPSRSFCFAVSHPKAREIHAAAFGDRVIHHLLVPALEVWFVPGYIDDLYSNRVGKGTHAAVRRQAHFMRCARRNGETPAWYLQLDVRNFFNSIDHAILLDLIQGRLARACPDAGQRNDLLWLEGKIIRGANQMINGGDPPLLARVPPHKQLAAAGPGWGLPIGNLTSHFFANVYLNELDQFVKHGLKARWYLRYVDDRVLVDADPARLQAWGEAIAAFLGERLHLTLKTPWRSRPVGDGADFLGYIVRPWYRLVRRRVIGHLDERLASYKRQLLKATKPALLPQAALSRANCSSGSDHPILLDSTDVASRRPAGNPCQLLRAFSPRPRVTTVGSVADSAALVRSAVPGHAWATAGPPLGTTRCRLPARSVARPVAALSSLATVDRGRLSLGAVWRRSSRPTPAANARRPSLHPPRFDLYARRGAGGGPFPPRQSLPRRSIGRASGIPMPWWPRGRLRGALMRRL